MLQVVLRPLWNAAVVAYQHLEDKEGLYKAWRWTEAHAQDWVPSQQACYVAMLLAVTALHHRPMQVCHAQSLLEWPLTCMPSKHAQCPVHSSFQTSHIAVWFLVLLTAW